MKTKVTFKYLTDGKVRYRRIPIEHSFKVKPPTIFKGYKFREVSVESQVIDYLDSIDKSDIMHKYNMDIIIDYWIENKKFKRDEVMEFVLFCEPYLVRYPQLRRSFSAVIADSKDVLFGHNKSNETKFKEVINSIDLIYKAFGGFMDSILKDKKLVFKSE